MNVSVAVKGEGQVKPGAEVEVEVTTTDPQGRPLAAELSLAMIEQALLDRFPSNVPAIDVFFRGNRRASAVRTTSSITFRYEPATHAIDANLLAERERLETEAEEAGALDALAESLPANRSEVLPAEGPAAPGGAMGGGAQNGALPPAPMPAARPGARLSSSRDGVARFGYSLGRGSSLAYQPEPAGNRQPVPQLQILQSQSGQAGIQLGDFRMSTPNPLFGDTLSVNEVQDFGIIPQDKVAAGKVLRVLQRNERGYKDSTIAFFGRRGTWGYANLGEMDEKKLDAFAEKLAETGAVLLPAEMSPETAYWNPTVTSDAAGKAKLTITVPDRATAWKFLARGVTAGDTLAGEGEAKLVAKKVLFGELKLPLALVDGDVAELVATVHNDLIKEGTIHVTLKTTIGSWINEETKTVEVKRKGLAEVLFKTKIDRRAVKSSGPSGDKSTQAANPDVEALFELTVTAGQAIDIARRAVPIKPYGMTVFNTTSGSAASDTTAWISLPDKMQIEQPALQIVIGPNVERSLLDVVLAPAPWCQREANRFATSSDSTSSDLMATLALMELLKTTQQAGGPEAQTLDTRIRAAIGSLVSAQRDDGAWSWCGGADKNAVPDQFLSARTVWALSLAQQAGYKVPDNAIQKGGDFLQAALAKLASADDESRAVLVHALTMADKGDFAQVNRLYRSRQSLSPAALCYLALSYASMDRMETARAAGDCGQTRSYESADGCRCLVLCRHGNTRVVRPRPAGRHAAGYGDGGTDQVASGTPHRTPLGAR